MGNSNSVLNGLRCKLNKQGKDLLDQCIVNCSTLSEEELQETVRSRFEELLLECPVCPIHMLKFSEFAKLQGFPRFPDVGNVYDLDSIDRKHSLFIYVSHTWFIDDEIALEEQCVPDNSTNDKFKLCVNGIEQMIKRMAPTITNCYLWFDYSCTNQDTNPIQEMDQLDKIIQGCDAIFTPIIDDSAGDWVLPQDFNTLTDYKASLWSGDTNNSYLSSAWCRLECLYADTIPLLDDEDEKKRHSQFKGALGFHASLHRRPHFIYGTKELMSNSLPVVLPPLSPSFYSEYHPSDGYVNGPSDKVMIDALIIPLQPFLDQKIISPGYKGEVDENGERHGHGTLILENGEVYDGQWKHGAKDGHGTYRFVNGNVYEGHWMADKQHGKGTLHYCNGEVYEGNWENDKKYGHGVYHHMNGDVYDGQWKDDDYFGRGICRYNNGEMYEGDWKHNDKHGHGKFHHANGDTYDGQWQDNIKCGHGIYRYSCGSVYEGCWQHDMKHGRGTFHYAEGNVYQGEFEHDKKHGYGTFRKANGEVSEGEWDNGKRL